MLRFISSILLFSLLGCTDFALNTGNDSTDSLSEQDTAQDTGDTDQTNDISPKFWSISGVWTLRDGLVSSRDSNLSISYWFNDVDFCEYEVTEIDAANEFANRPDDALLTWWNITFLYPDQKQECDWSITGADSGDSGYAELNIGFGPYDERLSGALGASGIDPQNSSTFGLYLSEPKSPDNLLIFGVVGTDAQYTGPGEFNPDDPIPDGSYLLTALYLLPY